MNIGDYTYTSVCIVKLQQKSMILKKYTKVVKGVTFFGFFLGKVN